MKNLDQFAPYNTIKTMGNTCLKIWIWVQNRNKHIQLLILKKFKDQNDTAFPLIDTLVIGAGEKVLAGKVLALHRPGLAGQVQSLVFHVTPPDPPPEVIPECGAQRKHEAYLPSPSTNC